MFVLTAKDQKDNGCIANTCFQVGCNPTRLAISVQQENFTREIIEKTGIFNVSVLLDDVPFETIRHFGMQTGREVDKFASFPGVQRSHNGLLYLTENTKTMFSCKVQEKVELGSHTMFIGEVTESKVLRAGTPCTYAHYHKAIKPKF